MFKKNILLVFVGVAILLVFPQSALAQQFFPSFDCVTGFKQIFDGITMKEFTVTAPRNLNWWVVKVNLDNPNIDLFVTPENGLGTTTSTFLQKAQAEVAINGDYSLNSIPLGLAASDGDIYKQPLSPNEPTMYISRSNDVSFSFDNGANVSNPFGKPSGFDDPTNNWSAISGGRTLVRNRKISDKIRNCEEQANYCENLNPRTAVGKTSGNSLVLMVVDGRSSQSGGVTFRELADMLVQCGVQSAIDFDGGGSTTLVTATQGIVNQPSDGVERSGIGNHLGVCIGPCMAFGGEQPSPDGGGLVDLFGNLFNWLASLFFGFGNADPYAIVCADAVSGLSHIVKDEFPENHRRPPGLVDCTKKATRFVSFTGEFSKILEATFDLPAPFDKLEKFVTATAKLKLKSVALLPGLQLSKEFLQLMPDVEAKMQATANTAFGNYSRPVFTCQIQNHIEGNVDSAQVIAETGALNKLRPTKLKSPISGDMVKSGLAEAENTIAQVMIGYGCTLLVNDQGEKIREDLCKLEWQFDKAIAFVTDGGQVSCSNEGNSRQLMISDFACGNPNFRIPGTLSQGEINQICSEIYGTQYRQGVTSANSILGQFFGGASAIKRPGFAHLYPPGTAWRYIPIVNEQDILYTFTETVNSEPQDPGAANPTHTFNATYPVYAVRDIAGKLFRYFKPYTSLKGEDIPPPNCRDCIKSAAEVAAGSGDDTPFNYELGDTLENPHGSFDFSPHVLGINESSRLLAQAQPGDLLPGEPIPTPEPDPITVTQEEVRTSNIVMQLPEPFYEAHNNVVGPGTGVVNPFLPKIVIEALNTPISPNGPPLNSLPAPIAMVTEDQQVDRIIGMPAAGGWGMALHRCGYLNSMTVFPVGYKKKWCQGSDSSDSFYRTLSQNIININLSHKVKDIFSGLASFQSSVNPLDDLSSK